MSKNSKLKIVPLSQWDKHFSSPSITIMRRISYRRSRNRAEEFLSIINYRLYIDVEKFQLWHERQPDKAAIKRKTNPLRISAPKKVAKSPDISPKSSTPPIEDYLTLKDFCKKYPSITNENALRWILFHSPSNGSEFFVRRLGTRKLLISPTLFFEWIENSKRNIS